MEARLTFVGKQNRINIGKETVRLLGCPQFVTIYLSTNRQYLAVAPCDEHNLMSFRVPDDLMQDHRKCLRIYSKAFVESILRERNQFVNGTYCVSGNYSESQHAVLFPLSQLAEIQQ